MEEEATDNPPLTPDRDTESLSDGDTEVLRRFIETYETLSLLWNLTCLLYTSPCMPSEIVKMILRNSAFVQIKTWSVIILDFNS